MRTPDVANLEAGRVGTSVYPSDVYLFCSAGTCGLGSVLIEQLPGVADKANCGAALRARQDLSINLLELRKGAAICLQTKNGHVAALEPINLPGVGSMDFTFLCSVWQ